MSLLAPGLPPFPENPVSDVALEVVRRLQAAGHEACYVGGCVRDWLLRREPYDIDVATSATPEQVVALFEKSREVGVHFGVVLATIRHVTIEVATFRIDGEYIDFRRPREVKYGSMEDDARRRDFTVNAMFYDPIARRLHDFHGGALDLRRRVLRAVGNARARFEEDALRLLRAVRLAVRHDLEIEPNTRKAIVARAENLKHISRERVGEELLRILTGPSPGRAMRLMSELGLWAHVIPEIEALHGVEQGRRAHPEGDVFEHVVRVLDHLPEDPPPALAMAALLHDIAKPRTFERDEAGRIHFREHQTVGAAMAREIARGLKCSNELIETMASLIEQHMRFMDVTKMKESNLKRFVTQPDFQLHLDLHRADSLGSNGDLDAYEYCVRERRELLMEHGEDLAPAPLATGDDLIALGARPGPAFREWLDALRDEQLEGRVTTREAALDYLRGRIARSGA